MLADGGPVGQGIVVAAQGSKAPGGRAILVRAFEGPRQAQAPKTSMLVISHANDGLRLAILRMLGAAWQRCRYGRYRSAEKNTECEAAHTRYGRMRGILNAMPHAVWRGIGACQEAHHAMKHPSTGRTVRLSRKRPVAVSECSATFMWGMSDQAQFYG